MGDPTPAEELRAAAATLRSSVFLGVRYSTGNVAALMRARGPLADWLEMAAKHDEDGYLCCDNGPNACSEIVTPALAVARAINGGPR